MSPEIPADPMVPFWDQRDAGALSLYRPWITGSFRWTDLFAAHNEHRIALTRLADLARCSNWRAAGVSGGKYC